VLGRLVRRWLVARAECSGGPGGLSESCW